MHCIIVDCVLYVCRSVLSCLGLALPVSRPEGKVCPYIHRYIVTRMLLHLPVEGERSAWVEGRIQPDMIQGVESELLPELASVLS